MTSFPESIDSSPKGAIQTAEDLIEVLLAEGIPTVSAEAEACIRLFQADTTLVHDKEMTEYLLYGRDPRLCDPELRRVLTKISGVHCDHALNRTEASPALNDEDASRTPLTDAVANHPSKLTLPKWAKVAAALAAIVCANKGNITAHLGSALQTSSPESVPSRELKPSDAQEALEKAGFECIVEIDANDPEGFVVQYPIQNPNCMTNEEMHDLEKVMQILDDNSMYLLQNETNSIELGSIYHEYEDIAEITLAGKDPFISVTDRKQKKSELESLNALLQAKINEAAIHYNNETLNFAQRHLMREMPDTLITDNKPAGLVPRMTRRMRNYRRLPESSMLIGRFSIVVGTQERLAIVLEELKKMRGGFPLPRMQVVTLK